MFTNTQVRDMALKHMSVEFGTKRGWKKAAARRYEVSCSAITLMLQGKAPPPKAVLECLGLVKVLAYAPKEPQ